MGNRKREIDMTKERKLKCNIAAAELLGYEYITHNKLDSGAVSIKLHCNRTRLFNIFTSPADCLAVVKKLGEAYYSIAPYNATGKWCVMDEEAGKRLVETCTYETYEAAVGAACLEIKGWSK